MGTSAVGAIAVSQRVANARWATAALAWLTVLALVATMLLGANLAVMVLLAFIAAGQAFAYVLVRAGKLGIERDKFGSKRVGEPKVACVVKRELRSLS